MSYYACEEVYILVACHPVGHRFLGDLLQNLPQTMMLKKAEIILSICLYWASASISRNKAEGRHVVTFAVWREAKEREREVSAEKAES